MIISLDSNKVVKYQSKSDTGSEPTYFLLGVISHKDMLELQSEWTEKNSGTTTYKIVKKGLKGWENFKDSNNKNVEFKYNDESCLENIPLNILIELGNEIIKLNVLSELDKKN